MAERPVLNRFYPCRDRERTHRAQGDSVGSGAMDLVSYVEFQSSFTQLVRCARGFFSKRRVSFLTLRAGLRRADPDALTLAGITAQRCARHAPSGGCS